MKSELLAQARALGFDACGITSARSPDSSRHFLAWLDSGQHGEMAYLRRNREKRVDPEKVLPGAKSIICLAASYARDPRPAGFPTAHPTVPPGRFPSAKLPGVVARYARYADYHDVLRPALEALVHWLDQKFQPPAPSLWYVDTGPFLERDLAQRAGLGFAGKHTNLISRSLGNWFFLAQVITAVPLDPDRPEVNRCGSCTRCLAACPTQAITAPFQLDARRCISYLTIELKGSIPIDLRPLIGNRIYGCDDCLSVCPWNRFSRAGNLMRPHARPELQTPDLIDLLALDAAGFKQRFAGTPILRTKRRGLLRNVCVALGNSGDASAIPALEKAAQDPEPLVAEHALWALDQLRPSACTPPQNIQSRPPNTL